MTRSNRRSCRATSIAQAFQFVDTGNAELGFVALSQLARRHGGIALGCRRQSLYSPIRQDAVLLKTGADERSLEGLHRLLEGPGSAGGHRALRLRPRVKRRRRACHRLSAEPVVLTIELGDALDARAAGDRHAARLVARPFARLVEGGGGGHRSLPIVLPPTVLGFYLLIALGPHGPGGALARLWGAPTLAFTFGGLVVGSVI